MMTQTHSLIAVALFANPKRSTCQNFAILFGSLVPDIAILGLFFWSKINQIPERQLWEHIYFEEPMLTLTAIGNSLPLYCFIMLVFVLISLLQHNSSRSQHSLLEPQYSLPESQPKAVNKAKVWSYITNSAIVLFSLAAVTHLLGDFPVHAEDAHPHFWPLTDWRFESSISYWDYNHHGGVFSYFEAILGFILSVIVFRRFKSLAVKVLTSLAMLLYIAVPIYFSLIV